jgi:hypothetical protein
MKRDYYIRFTMIRIQGAVLTISFLLSLQINAQTVHIGGGFTYYNHFLLNKEIKFEGNDSVYVYTTNLGGGIMAAAYFDPGAYYFRKLYGIKAELQFSRAAQTYKVYPGNGLANFNYYYKFRTQASYLDVPLLFNFCNTHHQGFTLDVGPQISFLQNVKVRAEESTVGERDIPQLTRQDFKPILFSAVIGAGCFYNFSEQFAMIGTFRMGYSLSDMRVRLDGVENYTPTRRFWSGAVVMGIWKFAKYYSKKNRGYQHYKRQLSKR